MEKTYKQLFEFLGPAKPYADANPKTKLAYAINRTIQRLKGAIEEYNELQNDENVNFASVDKDGNLLTANKEYVFTKENVKKRNEAIKQLQKKTFTFEPYYATEIPELEFFVVDALTGFVIEGEPSSPPRTPETKLVLTESNGRPD